jgi:beta-glucosidase
VRNILLAGFAEAGRDYNTVDIGESTLQNIVFPPLKLQLTLELGLSFFNELNGIQELEINICKRDFEKKLEL